MSRRKIDIALKPDLCDRCGRCQRVCEPGALKVGASYLYLDWRACTECMKCVDACERGAIVRHTGTARKAAPAPRARAAGGAVDRTVVRDRPPAPRAKVVPGVGPVAWTPLEAVAVAAVALATFFAKDAALASSLVEAMPAEGRVFARVAVLIAFYGAQLGALAFLARRRCAGLMQAFGLSRVHASWSSWASSAGWVLLLLIATRIAVPVWGVVAEAIGIGLPPALDGGLTEVFGPGPAGLGLSVALVVLIAPVVEEMLFRGVLLSALGARLGPGLALVGQALLFGAYHFSLWTFVPTFLLGLACGYLAQRRASLWPAVALHALFNAVPIALTVWMVSLGVG